MNNVEPQRSFLQCPGCPIVFLTAHLSLGPRQALMLRRQQFHMKNQCTSCSLLVGAEHQEGLPAELLLMLAQLFFSLSVRLDSFSVYSL